MVGRLEEAIAGAQKAQSLAEQASDLELHVSVDPALWFGVAGRNRERSPSSTAY